jgi:hypothetical protein
LFPATTTIHSIPNSALYRYFCVVSCQYCLEFIMANGKKAGKRAAAVCNLVGGPTKRLRKADKGSASQPIM